MLKCHFGRKEASFLGRTITPNSVTPQKRKITTFLEKSIFLALKKALQRYIGFLNYYKNYIPRLAERLNSTFQLLKTTESKDKIIIIAELMNEFRENNNFRDKCCQLATRQTLPDK